MRFNPIEKLNRLIEIVVTWFFGLFGVKPDSKPVAALIQFLKFNIVGVLNFLITTIVYSILVHTAIHPLAYAIGYTCGIVNSYICNKFWTFSSGDTKPLVESIKFFALCLAAYVASQATLLWLEPPIGRVAAYILSTVVALAINYLGSKFLVFKK